MDATELLMKARVLIEAGWTKKMLAKGPDGMPVDTKSPDAVEFCMIGSLLHFNDGSMEYDRTLHVAALRLQDVVQAQKGGYYTISEFNDSPSTLKKHVLRVFDKALESDLSAG